MVLSSVLPLNLPEYRGILKNTHRRRIKIMTKQKDREVLRAKPLLEKHRSALIEDLGAAAFDLLTPKQTANVLGVDVPRISDLVRQGWLASAPTEYDAGHAHQYYRWRVEFVKRYKTTYKKKEQSA
jgi:hypothetical protein